MLRSIRLFAIALGALLVAGTPGIAQGIQSTSSVPERPAFDIQKASVTRDDNKLVFRMEVVGNAGSDMPKEIGKLEGSSVYSYVWPTSFDPSVIGFTRGSGILAFAVTSHPDFDDTPWFDEDGDGDPGNDGRLWHSHWVVLAKTEECGRRGSRYGTSRRVKRTICRTHGPNSRSSSTVPAGIALHVQFR